jgi:hypothetical protein
MNGPFQQNGTIEMQPRFHKEKWTFERKNGAKIAVFHGKPNPHELINPHPHESINEKHVEWVKNYWN